MSDEEGVTAEVSTVQESVENQPVPEKAEAPKEAEDNETDIQEIEELSNEDIEQLENDPKVKAFLKKKTESQKNALRHSQEAIEKRNASNQEQAAHITKLTERIAELEAKKPPELKEDEFDTYEEYEKAKLKQDLKDDLRQEQIDEAKVDLNAKQTEQVNAAREVFQAKEAEMIASDPTYTESVSVVQDYIDMIPKDAYGNIADPGFREFSKFMTLEAENAPAMLNMLGKNPDKIEALMGKPPAFIKRKLQAYEKELSAPKKPPEIDPLPAPPTKTKGTAKPKVSKDKLADPDAYMKWRNSQKKRS